MLWQASHNKNQVYRLLQLREESTKKIRIHHKADTAEYKTERILNSDISNGKETMPISVVNGEDEEEAPTDFVYLIANCETVSQNINRTISSLQGCSCEKDGGCLSSKSCKCATLSKGSWYNRNTGRLLDSFNTTNKSNLIYECNQTCKCDVTLCPNRTVQRGIQVPLQIFRTKKKGWGVRTLGPVDKGTFICEYIGEIISDKEADHIKNDSYLFDLESKGGEVFCLDARDYGNVSRFINHHCQPNLISVKVLVEHQDTTAPRIALFAARDIAINEELGFDYGAKFWQIKLKYFTCECGDVFCRYGTTPK
ncbi:EHMT1 [Cordylochernes scorpioides]|uniref:EHMT1 n=1 Tax=Cordylochernes scorpioides TaxID=51811 RepID=A0ABY6KPU3_9ARAC|nr:EHMT1 [Cordylochernes scorpioides]